MKRAAIAVAALAVTSCARPSAPLPIELLTREGCANTALMKRHLDEALGRLSRPTDYEVFDLDRLPLRDPRRAYPTPTVLQGGHDIFGLAQPAPPYPEPT